MKWRRFIFLIVLVAVLQASAAMNLLSLTNLRIKPDILLILLVYFAVFCEGYDAIIISFAVGFAADLAGMVLGPHFIGYGIIGVALTHIRKIILLKSTGQQAMAVFITGIVAETIVLILTQFKAPEMTKAGVFEIFATAAYSAILWFLIKWPVSKVGKWLGVGAHRFAAQFGGR